MGSIHVLIVLLAAMSQFPEALAVPKFLMSAGQRIMMFREWWKQMWANFKKFCANQRGEFKRHMSGGGGFDADVFADDEDEEGGGNGIGDEDGDGDESLEKMQKNPAFLKYLRDQGVKPPGLGLSSGTRPGKKLKWISLRQALNLNPRPRRRAATRRRGRRRARPARRFVK